MALPPGGRTHGIDGLGHMARKGAPEKPVDTQHRRPTRLDDRQHKKVHAPCPEVPDQHIAVYLAAGLLGEQKEHNRNNNDDNRYRQNRYAKEVKGRVKPGSKVSYPNIKQVNIIQEKARKVNMLCFFTIFTTRQFLSEFNATSTTGH